MLIGVTGCIGSGKSMVARQLSTLLKAPLFDSDEICRELLCKDQPGYLQFVKSFGGRFLDNEQNIDRSLLRDYIFSDDVARTRLESILHPLVHERILSGHQMEPPHMPVIAEVPLLFESGWEHDFDLIICVVASPETTIRRITARDLVSSEEAGRIIGVQMDISEKARRSDWVIENDGDFDQTGIRIAEAAEMIRKRLGRE